MKKTYICPKVVVHNMEVTRMIAVSDTGLVITYDEADDSECLVKGVVFQDDSSFGFDW